MRSSQPAGRLVITEPARMCFGVSGCALFAALIAAIVNHYLAGWMGVVGMVSIGLLYLGMGFAGLRWENLATIDQLRGGRINPDAHPAGEASVKCVSTAANVGTSGEPVDPDMR